MLDIATLRFFCNFRYFEVEFVIFALKWRESRLRGGVTFDGKRNKKSINYPPLSATKRNTRAYQPIAI
jgi:hypothetical protein